MPGAAHPAFIVCEAVDGASAEEENEMLGLRLLRRRVAKAWKSFKLTAVSSFIYVETAGLLYGAKILSDSLGLTRTVHDPNTDGFDEDVIDRAGPAHRAAHWWAAAQTGFDAEAARRTRPRRCCAPCR